MLELRLHTRNGTRTILRSHQGLEYSDICKQLEDQNLRRETYYIVQNGRLISEDYAGLIAGQATLLPRILGGKGGFGSMLRAIGAQIEKTTNREACRDLSGRRLRDINEEKRLKAWIEKQESREEEEIARKKRKLEKLCAVPKHEFTDRKYDEERSALTGKVEDAIEEGYKIAAKAADVEGGAKPVLKKVRKTILDDDFDSDELDRSSEDSDDSDVGDPRKKLASDGKPSSSTSDNSSDDSRTATGTADKSADDDSSESSRVVEPRLDTAILDIDKSLPKQETTA